MIYLSKPAPMTPHCFDAKGMITVEFGTSLSQKGYLCGLSIQGRKDYGISHEVIRVEKAESTIITNRFG